MTIKIYSDRIDIGDFTLFEGNGGLQFDGVARAEDFKGNQGFQGSVAGFVAGGSAPPGAINIIEKFPFATNANATDHGDLTQAKKLPAGQSSTTHGYVTGGFAPPVVLNTIEKFRFATTSNATDVGDLTIGHYFASGHNSSTQGYSVYSPGPATTTAIQKFPFATDTNASAVGASNGHREGQAAHSSDFYGYMSGGFQLPVVGQRISKFSFISDAAAITAGSLTGPFINKAAGISSTTHGYGAGAEGSSPGSAPFTIYNSIYKFPFSVDSTTSTDVGDLTEAKSTPGGHSSTTHGYVSGGFTTPPPVNVNTIERFPFSTDTNASDVGDLTQERREVASHQV